MKKVGYIVTKYYKMIMVICMFLIIPALIGMYKTRINYDILVYLPDDIETIKGEKILTNDFHMGSYAICVIDNMKDKDIISLENNIRKIDGISKVISIDDVTGSQIPIEYIPNNIKSKVSSGNSKLVFVTFTDSTSSDKTLKAVQNIRNLVNRSSKVGGMSAMVLDTKDLFNSEMTLYVIIAVIFCIIVLMISLDSYVVPFLLILNIGIAILYNMGTNIFLGNISYITKAISSVLQLGVTTDFSIFLYHKYEKYKFNNTSIKAMECAINDTLVSVLGSSLTTIAGFLALCTMNLKLGTDIGIVMAKGVVFGLICVVTLFPALILTFDKLIFKTKHKVILPKFNLIKSFVYKYYKLVFIIFIILLFPAYKSQTKTPVYYKLDESIPSNYGYSKATRTLKNDYNLVSQEMILVSKDLSISDTNSMIDEIEKVNGIDKVISASKLYKYGIDESILSKNIKDIYQTDRYKLILVNSNYDIATDELNDQIIKVNKIVKRYDNNAIVAGEGPLMKDLVEITDQDFKNVNVTSIAIIFVIMLLVLKSISLPVLLVSVIEFAIFINMGIPYFSSTSIPFIASVVIGTIQLGATIDYAILMTTTYLDMRKQGFDKMEAVKHTLDSSISSIFVSGMCFFSATVGVALVSKIDLIGSLCTLISRGAIISMIVVILILPSILIIFDKLIIKTTIGGNNMKKKFASILLIFMLMLLVLPVKALKKEESVYAKLDSTGKLKKVTVFNHLINDEKLDKIIDYSNLKSIENTNGKEKYTREDNKLVWSAKKQDIYYSGDTKKDLPVSLDITYKLNNKNVNLKELLGKKGHVDIILDYTNKEKVNNLYVPFVVLTSTVLDGSKNSNININNGKIISNGKDYVIAGIALPGLYDSLNQELLRNTNIIQISFDTTDFELSSIYSVITPKVLDSFDLDKLNSLDNVYSSINKLSSSSKELVNGTKQVNDGVNTIYNGVESSIQKLKNNNESIDSNSLLDIQNKVSDETVGTISLKKEEIMNQAVNKLIQEENETNKIKQAYDYGIDSNEGLLNILKLAAHQKMQETEQGKQAYEACMNGINDYCVYVKQGEDEIINTIKSVVYNQAFELAKQVTATTAYETALSVAKETSYNVSGAVALEVFNNTKATVLNKVILSLEELKRGLQQLQDGTNKLVSGMEAFDNQGINKIDSIVNNNIKPNIEKIKDLRHIAHNYNTFTDSKDIDTTTKFIISIDGVSEKDKTIKNKPNIKKESFVDKVKNLFK